jgi:hypothetical protein
MTSVFGRDAELGEAEAFFSAPEPGLAGLAIVGEAGIGKTTVWEEALEIAGHHPRALVLAARPTESEARLSFAGLGDLLSAVPADAVTTLPRPQRRALDVALLRVAATAAPERRVLGVALASLLRTLAEEHAVSVAVDDVHWLDGP